MSDPSGERQGPQPARLRGDGSSDTVHDRHAGLDFQGSSGVFFEQAMAQTRMAVCLADPTVPQMPIVFANQAFLQLTGYDEADVLGRNCRFLQGPGTDPATVARIRTALDRREVIVVEILNYRKDGQRFWNALHMGPIYDEHGQLIYYFGSQWDVSDVRAARADEQHARAMARELSHRVKNIFGVIGGLVTVTGRTRGIETEAVEINDRIRALGRAFETTLDDASRGSVQLRHAVEAVLDPYDPTGQRVRLVGETVRVDPSLVSTVGLALHELASNARRHGALSGDEGDITLEWNASQAGSLRFHWNECGGPEVHAPARSGAGFGIIKTLISTIGGTVERDWQPDGLSVEIEIPDAVVVR